MTMSRPVKISRLAAPSCSLVNSINGTRSSVYCKTKEVKKLKNLVMQISHDLKKIFFIKCKPRTTSTVSL